MNTAEIPVTAWRKSRHSSGTGECVEIGTWRKSRQSNADNECVEVAAWPDGPQVSIRDSKDPDGPALTVTPADWRSFMSRIKVSHH
ncbi:MAG TPA: DUF397 domain-containing protein [Streptosporangiaceae bacterium]|nr:DUF397 domain-containing protein [Streptosporangiaceae bacterium]